MVQAYLTILSEDDQFIKQELIAFNKTKVLDKNEAQTLELSFKLSTLARYDAARGVYFLPKGKYLVKVGNCSRNTENVVQIVLNEEVVVKYGKNIFSNVKVNELHKDIPLEELNAKYDVPTINLTKDDFTLYVSQPRIVNIPEELDKLNNHQLAELNVGYHKEKTGLMSFIGESSDIAVGAVGQAPKLFQKLFNDPIVMSDGPAGLRLSKVYGIDNENFYHRMDENIVQMSNYGTLRKKKNITLIRNSTANVDLTKYQKVEFQYTIAIPIATALAQTFNFNLGKKIGKIIGKEMEKFNVDIWLAPALNIHRNILCGRNFEYFSEDPLLSGTMAAAIVRGVQSVKNKGATIKHYTANNQEFDRLNSNSKISERALREFYLKGFKIAIEKGNPFGLMTSYNLVNGLHTSENYNLIINVLRREWGYKGLIMTDWSTSDRKQFTKAKNPSQNAFNIIKAGVDIMMPGSRTDFNVLARKYNENLLTRNDLLRCAGKVYETIKLIKGDLGLK